MARSSFHRPAALAALAVTPLLAGGGTAYAECVPTSADLSWVRLSGAEGCPGAAAIRAEVVRRIGKDIGSPGEGKVIEAVVERLEGRWSVRIATSGCGAERTVRELTSDAPTCEPLASAAVLVIALTVDPGAALAPPVPPRGNKTDSIQASAPGAPTPAAPPPDATTKPARRPAPERPPAAPDARTTPPPGIETRVTWRGLLAMGLLPGVAPGLAWSAEWRIPPWLVVSSGLFHLPEQPAPDPTFAFGMTAGWVGLCGDLLRFSRIEVAPCARFLAGSIHAVVRTHPTIIGTGPGQRAWAGASAGARLGARIAGPVRAEVGADLIVPITRHAFVLRDEPEPVFLQPEVTGAIYLGVGVAFP